MTPEKERMFPKTRLFQQEVSSNPTLDVHMTFVSFPGKNDIANNDELVIRWACLGLELGNWMPV